VGRGGWGGTDPNGYQIGTSTGKTIESHNAYLEFPRPGADYVAPGKKKVVPRECSPIKFPLLSAALCSLRKNS
jgi:hypothetical protein